MKKNELGKLIIILLYSSMFISSLDHLASLIFPYNLTQSISVVHLFTLLTGAVGNILIRISNLLVYVSRIQSLALREYRF